MIQLIVHQGQTEMRAVIQRVSRASVAIAGTCTAEIGTGLLVLVAVEPSDTLEDIDWLCRKIVRLRIFNDEEGVMNRSVMEIGGKILAVSQFTLFASTRKGNRPSYGRAAPPDAANELYEQFLKGLAGAFGQPIQSGVFGADMQVSLVNDGPVTIIIDSRLKE
ncbi:D-aminoacyl-tRNA deacylase [bioreactor metagenome]|uniref:D-aminoacyl-tRNA deacylase n=1 Tax=bioreactor metagenome TaxID=1076179 RepID=A0A645BJU4_9ZZZZ